MPFVLAKSNNVWFLYSGLHDFQCIPNVKKNQLGIEWYHKMRTKSNNNYAMYASSVVSLSSPDLIFEGFDRNITERSRGGIMRLFTAARYSFEKNAVARRTSVPWTVNIHASSFTHFLCRFWLFEIAVPRRFANSCPSSESLGASACPSWWTRPPACLLLAYTQSTFCHAHEEPGRTANLEG